MFHALILGTYYKIQASAISPPEHSNSNTKNSSLARNFFGNSDIHVSNETAELTKLHPEAQLCHQVSAK